MYWGGLRGAISLALALSIENAVFGADVALELRVMTFGVVLHRSRFCFSRVFRDPFMIGDAYMTKAAILMLLIGILGNALLIYNGSHVYYDALTPVFWMPELLPIRLVKKHSCSRKASSIFATTCPDFFPWNFKACKFIWVTTKGCSIPGGTRM